MCRRAPLRESFHLVRETVDLVEDSACRLSAHGLQEEQRPADSVDAAKDGVGLIVLMQAELEAPAFWLGADDMTARSTATLSSTVRRPRRGVKSGEM